MTPVREVERFVSGTLAAGPVTQVVADAEKYTRFIVQLIACANGASVNVEVSLDGTNWAVWGSGLATVPASKTVAFSFDLRCPSRGGVRISFNNTGEAAGLMRVDMCGSPFARRSYNVSA